MIKTSRSFKKGTQPGRWMKQAGVSGWRGRKNTDLCSNRRKILTDLESHRKYDCGHGKTKHRSRVSREAQTPRSGIESAEKAAHNLRIDIDHLDVAIRLFTDDAPKRIPGHKVSHRASRGEMRRFVLRELRAADRPLTSLDITTSWIEEKGLQANEATYVMIRKRVGACLNTLKHSGQINPVAIPGEYKGWRLRHKTGDHEPHAAATPSGH